jgi:hypothetical protein
MKLIAKINLERVRYNAPAPDNLQTTGRDAWMWCAGCWLNQMCSGIADDTGKISWSIRSLEQGQLPGFLAHIRDQEFPAFQRGSFRQQAVLAGGAGEAAGEHFGVGALA